MRRLGRLMLWLLAAIGAVFVLFVLWLIATGPLFRVGARFDIKVAKLGLVAVCTATSRAAGIDTRLVLPCVRRAAAGSRA